MLWEIEIHSAAGQIDREAQRVLAESLNLGTSSITAVRTSRSFLIDTPATEDQQIQTAVDLLVDTLVEEFSVRKMEGEMTQENGGENPAHQQLLNVLFKPGVTDLVARSTKQALQDQGLAVAEVATCRKYWFNEDATPEDVSRLAQRVLANDAIEQILRGPLELNSLAVGSDYQFELQTVPLGTMDDERLMQLSREGQLYLSLTEMQTIQQYFQSLERDPTDIELESVAQTWSEHCSHKTLAGRIHYQDDSGTDRHFDNMLKETIFAATQTIRQQLGEDDWCVSVFEDNAGIVTFDEKNNVCFKVETHNHPSAIEPYGGANTGIGGVIRDPMGTGLGAKPLCNTDVFCFAPPDTSYADLPQGVLHPKAVAQGVVAGVRDYGNRMGIPTVNGAIYFDDRYLGNPLVYCGNVAMIPVEKCVKALKPGDYIVAVGGRTGRDGIHGATFSSAELTHESETISGGAVQIGNPITEKMVADVILEARDRGLYSAITDCGAGGFSSAVGEMGEKTGAEVWLERCPLKYSGLTYTEIWISEAQERMVLSVPPKNWEEFQQLCAAEGVEATIIGEFTETHRLVLKYQGEKVGDLAMEFLHDGRPPVIREARYESISETTPTSLPGKTSFDDDLINILSSLNVASKEWVIRQYDHEVQAGSVVKPLVGINQDGPSDAAVVRPDLESLRGLVVSCGMNPYFGDHDPYWMAASAIDEAMRNCVAVGADPTKVAILDNFCWGNTERPEILGSLTRAAIACHDVAVAFGTPFISGKDSLNNEFSYIDDGGNQANVTIPSSLLISALGQMDDITRAVTMDLKRAGNLIYLVGATQPELGGSHFALEHDLSGWDVPKVDLETAPEIFKAIHVAIHNGLVKSCHDLSEGGLAVSIAEMAFAGGLGAKLNLAALAAQSNIDCDAVLLFSESNTRFLVEISPDELQVLETTLSNVPFVKLGEVTEDTRLQITGCKKDDIVIDAEIGDLKAVWQKPLQWD